MDEPTQEQYEALAAAHLGHGYGHDDNNTEVRRSHDRVHGGALALYRVRMPMPAPPPAPATTGGGVDRRARALEMLEAMK